MQRNGTNSSGKSATSDSGKPGPKDAFKGTILGHPYESSA
jgi:hypothetical protein